MFKRLQTKLILIFALLLIVAMVTSQFITGSEMSRSFKKELDSIGAAQSITLNQVTELRLDNFAKDILQFSEQDEIKDILVNKGSLTSSMTKQMKSYTKNNPEVSAIYMGDPKKNMYDPEDNVYESTYDPRTRPWYKLANDNKDHVTFTEPYMDLISKKMKISISKAIVENDKVQGVITLDLDLEQITEQINETNVGYNGHGFILDSEGNPIVLPNSDGKNQMDKPYVADMYKKDAGKLQYTDEGTKKITYYTTSALTGWKIGAVYKEKELLSLVNQIQQTNLIITLIAIIAASIIVYFVARFFTKPIAQLTNSVQLMAEGDLTVQGEVKSKDEIGQLTSHFNLMAQKMREVISRVIDSSEKLSDSAVSLSAVSEETKAASEEIAHAMTDVAKGSMEGAINIENMQRVTMELNSQFTLIQETMDEMQDNSTKTQGASVDGRDKLVVLQTRSDESFQEIQAIEQVLSILVEKINDIKEVAATMNGISGQTNLLALNASIEAARAGEAGKGFSVVASEIRKLAEKSAEHADQIRDTIVGIVEEAENATEAMTKTKEITLEQNAAVKDTETAFMTIQELMNQVIQSIDQMSGEMKKTVTLKDDVVQSIESLSAISEESAAAAEEVSASTQDQLKAIDTVSQAAEDLSQSSSELEQLVKRFTI
ncbi:methyl-accepting chemotaxis protein [Paenibacillus motobuensis]|uniref:methyl-accepting chemotaxis protein n=1 Tax=Paenibacillus TaxID=44249 RepID=UPI00203C0968|nr:MULTISPECIES: methyl-accepting chemotaxis protein [Paenibacillus]MCM3039393.1 methyl-accepting chemotaxis protein [Paenibacillus lutimineralis]MCM3646497.1 methyl-accepting chemotaxis protein [Paenibacillus motobuensis]